MLNPILFLPRNLVRRNYIGGAGISQLHNDLICTDSNQPEEWVGSLIEARNPGLENIEHEGLAFFLNGIEKNYLVELIKGDPAYYLGDIYTKEQKYEFGFLFKILDSAMRLHVQAHPTAEFARKYMNAPYGKLECYYILEVRDGVEGYIRLGFQKEVSKKSWRKIIKNQEIVAMDQLFEKIPVKPGEVWYIPGGMPHAIGEGITMLEIMEPSDLVVRCEFCREGITVPPEARFMGRDLDFCLDIFDYTKHTKEEIREQFCLEPKVLSKTPQLFIEELIGSNITKGFQVLRVSVKQEATYIKDRTPEMGVVCKGNIRIEQGETALDLKQGDSFFLAGSITNYRLINLAKQDDVSANQVELCIVSTRMKESK